MAKKKNDFQIGAVIAAAGAGFAADKIDDLLTNKIKFFADKPGLTPAVISVAALGAIYFGNESEIMKAAGYGALGVSGAKVGDTLIPMNGFNRLVYKNTNPMKVTNGFNRMHYTNTTPQNINGHDPQDGTSLSQVPYQENVARQLGLEEYTSDNM